MFEYFASSVAFAHQSFEEACQRTARLGLREIDLWSIQNWCEHLPPQEDTPDLGPAREILARHGLGCHALSVYGHPLDRAIRWMPHAVALGAGVMVRGSDKREMPVAEFAGKLGPAVAEAERLGIVLAIENHGHAVIDSIASMVELCERIASPHLGIALAPIHLHNRGEATAEAIRQLGHRIALFYAWDWGPSANVNWKDPTEQVPGKGVISFPPIFQALRDIAYPRPLCLFAHGLEDIPPDAAEAMMRDGLAFCHACDVAQGG